MKQPSDYSNLITAEHAGKPKFKAMVEAVTGCFADCSNLYRQIVQSFDLDDAIGTRLDIIGLWVGLSRYISTPLSVYFSFDTDGLGFGQGNWKGPFDPVSGLTRLDDETYRLMIRAKIGANAWDGTLPGLLSIYGQVFAGTGTVVFAQDNQDMSMGVYLAGATPTAILQSLISNGYLPLKPEGVKVNYSKTSASGSPLFGFDVQNQYVAGFDAGAWGIPL